MIANLIIKALLFYLVYLVIRGLWRGYKIYGAMQEAIKQGRAAGGSYQRPQGQKTSRSGGDVIEAEYRIIK